MFRTITPIFSIVLAIIIYFFFTSDIFSEIKTTQAQTEQFEKAVAKGKEYNQKLESELGKKRAINALETERINTFIPTDIDEVRLLVDLEEMARTHNMLLGNIKVSEAAVQISATPDASSANQITMSDFLTTDVSFGLIGTYEQFRAMLTDIEKSLVLMEVIDISYNANEGDLQQFGMTIRAYALKPSV